MVCPSACGSQVWNVVCTTGEKRERMMMENWPGPFFSLLFYYSSGSPDANHKTKETRPLQEHFLVQESG